MQLCCEMITVEDRFLLKEVASPNASEQLPKTEYWGEAGPDFKCSIMKISCLLIGFLRL